MYYPQNNLMRKMKDLILLCYRKTPTTQCDNLEETLSAYSMSLISLCKKPMGKILRWTYSYVHIVSLKTFSFEILIKLIKGK
jgi:hypothetical protein